MTYHVINTGGKQHEQEGCKCQERTVAKFLGEAILTL